MKIYEILKEDDTEPTKPTFVKTKASLDQLRPGRKSAKGAGAFGFVRPNPLSAHEVIKTHYSPEKADTGYDLWAQAVIKYNNENPGANPFLPTFRTRKVKTDPSGKQRTQYVMPQYQRGDHVPLAALIALGEQLFPGFTLHMKNILTFDTDDFMQIEQNDTLINRYDTWNEIIFAVKSISKNSTDKSPLKTNNKQLIQAVNLVDNVLQRWGGAGLDIHSGNLMVKDTGGTGKQLIFTDPVAG